jgi:hypothetical protein
MYCIFSSCELLIAFSTLPNLSLPRCLIVIAAILAFVLLVTVTVTLAPRAADRSQTKGRRANFRACLPNIPLCAGRPATISEELLRRVNKVLTGTNYSRLVAIFRAHQASKHRKNKVAARLGVFNSLRTVKRGVSEFIDENGERTGGSIADAATYPFLHF